MRKTQLNSTQLNSTHKHKYCQNLTSEIAKNNKLGFTLIELSIVFVIIGLIVGGTLVGQDLYHSAELRSTVTQYEQITTAMNTFRVKYNCLAGDCASATDFFPSASIPNYCITPTLVKRAATYNGDGNGIIKFSNNYGYDESTAVWQHLADAGLIAGQYSGGYIAGYCGYGMKPGINVPAAKMAYSGTSVPAGYAVAPNGLTNPLFFSFNPSTGTAYFPAPFDSYLSGTANVLMLSSSVSNGWSFYGLAAIDAKNIDKKIDDGKPLTGRMVGLNYQYAYCISNGEYTPRQ
ncbi:MAG: prepilin-type N-terminal cleavage/methylation domain-containing protein [Pseudomonadota bacterium]